MHIRTLALLALCLFGCGGPYGPLDLPIGPEPSGGSSPAAPAHIPYAAPECFSGMRGSGNACGWFTAPTFSSGDVTLGIVGTHPTGPNVTNGYRIWLTGPPASPGLPAVFSADNLSVTSPLADATPDSLHAVVEDCGQMDSVSFDRQPDGSYVCKVICQDCFWSAPQP